MGIISSAYSFYWGGPLRAASPDNADDLAIGRDAVAYALDGWGAYLILNSGDSHGQALASKLFNLSSLLFSMDGWWCGDVSYPYYSWAYGYCTLNDTVVPLWSQAYDFAGAATFWIQSGPAHIQETRDRGDTSPFVYQVLADYTHIPPLGGGSGPGFSCDGPAVLNSGDWIGPGGVMVSSDCQFELVYQYDGNLVLLNQSLQPLWDSGTWGTDPGIVAMQGDGNLVIYNAYWTPVWASGTDGDPGAWCVLQNDSNFVVYSWDSVPLWASW